MADHTAIHPPESLPFPSLYHLQVQGQRSSHSLFHNSSVNRLSQYGESSLICEQTDGAETSMNRAEDQMTTTYWDIESSCSSQPVAMSRNKPHTGVYEGEWSSVCEQQEAMGDDGVSGVHNQKLDSFSEAFCGRAISRINGGGEQGGYNSSPSLSAIAFPLVLSPPPTPLPTPSLSPPKRGPGSLPPVTQALIQTQSHSPSEASSQFFPGLNLNSTSLPGNFASAHWLPISNNPSGSGDVTQQLSQNSSPSSVYPEGVGLQLRQLSATQRDTDCFLQTSPCSPAPKLQMGHDAVPSEGHLTLSNIVQSSQSFCYPPHQSLMQAGGLRVGEDMKSSSEFQRPLMYLPSSQVQNASTPAYTGVPFCSVLHSEVLKEDWEDSSSHYIPSPMLNPTRSGTGLYCNLLSLLDNRGLWSEETGNNTQQRHVNIGPEFQVELPNLLERSEITKWPEEQLREELLWKPWAELEEDEVLQERVESLLDLSTSTALPGGSTNLELALHSLSLCQGNMLAALDMMFFSSSAPSRDYHYAGSDIWCLSEQNLFHKAFAIYGKDFSSIHKMVKTKQVSQCVEFFYHSKPLQEKQRKQKEREKEPLQMDTELNITPTNQVMMPSNVINLNVERLIHPPSLATSFPCKQCGKMFYKIKSRNAHMKIHRQQQEDWRERVHSNNHHNLSQVLQNPSRTLTHPNQLVTQAHQNQILTQSLIQNFVQSQAQLAFLQGTKTQGTCYTAAISNANSTQNPQTSAKTPTMPTYAGHQQTWEALHGILDPGLYYDKNNGGVYESALSGCRFMADT